MDRADATTATQQRPPAAQPLLVLGLETSCDDTAAAVLRLSPNGAPEILADRVVGQNAAHAPYGGVVPEIAARAHAERLDTIAAHAMADAEIDFCDLDGVAATTGPGLVGGVMVGAMTGKAIALAWEKPFIAVNHLEGHALSARLAEPIAFPYLLLLVSGGHTQLLVVEDVGQYRRLGSTIDDAVGEAFDKTAKILGLGHPGGPELEALAQAGDPNRFPLPRPLTRTDGCDFSFAGLKTAAMRALRGIDAPTDADRADLAASFQQAAADVLSDRTRRALSIAGPHVTALVVAGGVAANGTIRSALARIARHASLPLIAPPQRWCTDNAAMIALVGAERLSRGLVDALDAPSRPRWPLDEAAARARPTSGAGQKGPKA